MAQKNRKIEVITEAQHQIKETHQSHAILEQSTDSNEILGDYTHTAVENCIADVHQSPFIVSSPHANQIVGESNETTN